MGAVSGHQPPVQHHTMLLILALFLLPPSTLESGVAVSQTARQCQDRQTCLVMSDCPYYQDKVEYRRSLPDGNEKRELTNLLKDQVCIRS